MFSRKLTLTATTCNLLEDMRLALEVWAGLRVRLGQIEFEKGLTSGHGSFFVNGVEFPLIFAKESIREIYFDLKIGDKWFVARFDNPRTVRIAPAKVPLDEWKWMVGTSAIDRHEEAPHALPAVGN